MSPGVIAFVFICLFVLSLPLTPWDELFKKGNFMRLNNHLLVQHIDPSPKELGCTVVIDESSGEEVCIPDEFLDALLTFLKSVADNR